MPMKIDSLKKLYIHSLKDLYHAEHQLVEALPKMEKAASSGELKAGFREHVTQTRAQIERLERIFEELGVSPTGVKCDAMEGLISEGEEAIKEIKEPEVRDAGLIGAAQKVEHYEIASYGTARAFARLLGYENAVELLTDSLEEEVQTDERLTELALSGINENAVE